MCQDNNKFDVETLSCVQGAITVSLGVPGPLLMWPAAIRKKLFYDNCYYHLSYNYLCYKGTGKQANLAFCK